MIISTICQVSVCHKIVKTKWSGISLLTIWTIFEKEWFRSIAGLDFGWTGAIMQLVKHEALIWITKGARCNKDHAIIRCDSWRIRQTSSQDENQLWGRSNISLQIQQNFRGSRAASQNHIGDRVCVGLCMTFSIWKRWQLTFVFHSKKSAAHSNKCCYFLDCHPYCKKKKCKTEPARHLS